MLGSDIAIIGGGIHGVSAAYHLVATGASVRLFESGAPAGGPTGRSSAICRAYYSNHFLALVTRESLDLIRDLPSMTGHDVGYRRTGMLFLHPSEDVPKLEESARHLHEIGTAVEILGEAALARRFPELSLEDIAVGAWEIDAGYADPVLTTNALYRAACAAGLVAHLHTQVTALRAGSAGRTIIETAARGTFECDRLLVCAGPWTRPLVCQLGVDLPLSVERHYVATFGWGTAPTLPYAHADVAGGYYMRPEGKELLLTGPLTPEQTADPDAFDDSLHEGEIDRMARALTARVPALAACVSRGGWASLYDVSPDWQPVIGEVTSGVFVDAGTSGHGFKLAPGLGRYVADLVLGRPHPGLAPFHPERFAAGPGLDAGYGQARILG